MSDGEKRKTIAAREFNLYCAILLQEPNRKYNNYYDNRLKRHGYICCKISSGKPIYEKKLLQCLSFKIFQKLIYNLNCYSYLLFSPLKI